MKAQEQLARLQADGRARQVLVLDAMPEAAAEDDDAAEACATPSCSSSPSPQRLGAGAGTGAAALAVARPATAGGAFAGGGGTCGGYPTAVVGDSGVGAHAANEEVGRSLESHRREVAILRNALRLRDCRESDLMECQRRLKTEHTAEKQEWEGQVASLVCEVQDLEARNRRLEAAIPDPGDLLGLC